MLIENYSKYLLKILPIYSYSLKNNNLILTISVKKLKKILFFLKKHSNTQYKILTDIVGVDFVNEKKRFRVIYNLLSLLYNNRVFIQILLNGKQPVQSIIKIYKNSNWFEREVWDMFGIFFLKHPDLKRILTDYGFEGFPLRKDFPLVGFLEVQYNENKKNITYNVINVSRRFYNFSFENTWLKNC